MQIAMQIDADDDADQLGTLHRHLHRVCIELHRTASKSSRCRHRANLHRPRSASLSASPTLCIAVCMGARCGFSAGRGVLCWAALIVSTPCAVYHGQRRVSVALCVGSKDPGTRLRVAGNNAFSLLEHTTVRLSLPTGVLQHPPGAYSTRRAPFPPHHTHHPHTKQWSSSPPVLSLRVGCPTPCPPRCVRAGTLWCSGASCLDRILNASAQNVAVAATSMYLSYTGTKRETAGFVSAAHQCTHSPALRATARRVCTAQDDSFSGV